MCPKNVIKPKIPGDVSCSKKEGQGYIDSLERRSNLELNDLLERQNKLLANKSFLSKLPDKGEKINKFRDKVIEEIAHRNEIDTAANLMSRLNIVSEGKDAVNKMEWTGKYEAATSVTIELDSDDEDDPLKILAQPTGAGVHKKKIIKVIPEVPLITADDLKEIEDFKNEDATANVHLKYILDRCERPDNNLERKKGSFKPYKTTITNVHDPIKEKERMKRKGWENTAATPPLIVHGAAKLLNISESLALQKAQTQRLQEVQAQHAIERLTQSLGSYAIGAVPINPGAYRTATDDSDSSDTDEEHTEVHDEDDADKTGTVVFNIDS